MNNQEQKIEKQSFIAKYAKIAVAVAVFFGAMSGSFASLITASAIAIGFWRLTIALPFFAIPVLANKEKRNRLKQVSKKNLLWCFISGVFLFAHFFSWFSAVKSTNVSSAAVLASFHPLVVLFITVFIYHKKVSWKSICAILVAILGGAIIMCSDITALSGGHLKGNIYAFLAAMFMGVYFAIGDKVRKEVEGGIYVLLVFASCWLSFGISAVITKTPFLGYPMTDYIYMALLAIICQIGSHAVLNLCIGHVSSLYVSTWEAGDPVFSTLIAMVLLMQFPSVYEIIGCVITVGALALYNKFEIAGQVGE